MSQDLWKGVFLGSVGSIVIGSIISLIAYYNNQPHTSTTGTLRARNGSKIYHILDIITYLKLQQHQGKSPKLFLDFYPHTNYEFETLNISGTIIRRFVGNYLWGFHGSGLLFRDHLNIIGLREDCYVELTSQQQEYIGISQKIPVDKTSDSTDISSNETTSE